MKSLFSMISIRGKLLLGYGLAFILTIVGAGVITHYMVRGVIESRIEDELKVSTTAIYTMLEATADITIKNHLRGIAQRNRDIVDFYYQRFRRGELTEAEAKRNVRRILLSQQIGKTGYIYCVNSEGVAVVHKSPGVEGSNFLYRSFVQDQIKRKEGYLIYDWQNPGDPEPRPKALYMTYFEPWDWIISVPPTDPSSSISSMWKTSGKAFSISVSAGPGTLLSSTWRGRSSSTLRTRDRSTTSGMNTCARPPGKLSHKRREGSYTIGGILTRMSPEGRSCS